MTYGLEEEAQTQENAESEFVFTCPNPQCKGRIEIKEALREDFLKNEDVSQLCDDCGYTVQFEYKEIAAYGPIDISNWWTATFY